MWLEASCRVHPSVCVTGGGKVEVWDVEQGQAVQSIRAQDDAISAVKVTSATMVLGRGECSYSFQLNVAVI